MDPIRSKQALVLAAKPDDVPCLWIMVVMEGNLLGLGQPAICQVRFERVRVSRGKMIFLEFIFRLLLFVCRHLPVDQVPGFFRIELADVASEAADDDSAVFKVIRSRVHGIAPSHLYRMMHQKPAQLFLVSLGPFDQEPGTEWFHRVGLCDRSALA